MKTSVFQELIESGHVESESQGEDGVPETGWWRNEGMEGRGTGGYEGGTDSEGLLVRALTPRLSQIARPSQRTSGLRKNPEMEPRDKAFETPPLSPYAPPPRFLLSNLHHLHSSNAHGTGFLLCPPPPSPPHMVAHVSHMYATQLSTQTPWHKQARSHSDLRLDRCMRPSLSV